jgi:enamine deaminase RidA (YjgF/YER057c/UK114 family)
MGTRHGTVGQKGGEAMRELNPNTIAPPFARYAHGVLVPGGKQLICTSGQLGLAKDGRVPESVEDQADICFANLDAIIAEGGASRSDVIRLNAYVTDRSHMAGYMVARDRWLANVDRLPASTLMIVSGFTRPEFLVEIEVLAAVAGKV